MKLIIDFKSLNSEKSLLLSSFLVKNHIESEVLPEITELALPTNVPVIESQVEIGLKVLSAKVSQEVYDKVESLSLKRNIKISDIVREAIFNIINYSVSSNRIDSQHVETPIESNIKTTATFKRKRGRPKKNQDVVHKNPVVKKVDALTFANEFKAARIRHNITQKEVCSAVKCGNKTFKNFEEKIKVIKGSLFNRLVEYYENNLIQNNGTNTKQHLPTFNEIQALSNELVSYRRKNKKTLHDISKRMGISTKAVTKFETNPSPNCYREYFIVKKYFNSVK
jgi:transcriptional regulator with XRE-family HTH domain